MFISIHILVHFSLQTQCFTKKVIKQKSAYCLTQIKKSFKIDIEIKAYTNKGDEFYEKL